MNSRMRIGISVVSTSLLILISLCFACARTPSPTWVSTWALPVVLSCAAVALFSLSIRHRLSRAPSRSHEDTSAAEALRSAERFLRYQLIRTGSSLTPDDQRVANELQAELARLRGCLTAGSLPDEEISESAARLERLRVHLFAREQLELLATRLMSNLYQYGVPREVIVELRPLVRTLRTAPLPAARSAAEELHSEHDYWGTRLDAWAKQANTIALVGLPLGLATLLCSISSLNHGHPVLGIVLAGATGATASILQRLPGIAVIGRSICFWERAAARYLTGILSAVVGLGVVLAALASPMFSRVASFSEALASCMGACSSELVALIVGLGVAFGFAEQLLDRLTDSVSGRFVPRAAKNGTSPEGSGGTPALE